MPCTHLNISGTRAIICGPKRIPRCVKCGGIGTRECDWKLTQNRTCDKSICESCSVSPAPEKDLCPVHADAWTHHPRNATRIGA